MSRLISSLSEEETDTDDYPADTELSSNLPMHAEDDDTDDKENTPPPFIHQPLPPTHTAPSPTSRSSYSSPIKRPPHKRHRPSHTAAPSSPSHDASLMLLDIGGVLFKTSRSTLLSIPNTYFTAHLTFTTAATTTTAASQPLFIDRDSAHFRHVLNYMRDRSLPDGLTLREVNELYREATYYAIDELRQHIDQLRTDMRQREDEAERRRETERLLLHATASDRQQQQLWPHRSLSNPLHSAAMAANGAALAAPMSLHPGQRAMSSATDFQLDADF